MDDKKKRERTALHVPRWQKLEDFESRELVFGLAASISDDLYRSYLPELKQAYERHLENEPSYNLSGNLDVGDLSDEIRVATEKKLVDAYSDQIVEDTLSELGSTNDLSSYLRTNFILQMVRTIILAPVLCVAIFYLSQAATTSTSATFLMIILTVCLAAQIVACGAAARNRWSNGYDFLQRWFF